MRSPFLPGSKRPITILHLACCLFALGIGLASPAAAVLPVPTDCLPDSDGANDETGQKDITLYCVDAGDGSPFELNTIANFDIIALSGANTADVCVLLNTDGDRFANFAVCVTVDGDGPGDAIVLDTIRLFTCTDTDPNGCSGAVLIAAPYSTTCEVTQEDTDPFPGPAPGPGTNYPADTRVLCGIDLGDFGAAGAGAIPLDVCSYPSTSPNSAHSDCIAFSTCTVDGDCNDGNACTTDDCGVGGECVFTPTPGATCSDGLFCNGEEACTALGLCGAGSGTPVDCDDGVSCTQDTCDELGDVCANDPMNSLCNDGLYCTGVETCDPVNDCQAGTPPNCSDGIGCTTDTCDEAGDTCTHAPSDGACDNGLYCDGSETCDLALGCLAGTPPACGDGVPCTDDSCNEVTNSCDNVANDANCDNGAFCDGSETCDAILDCQAGTPPDCDDAIGCTTDACNELADQCDHTPDDSVCDNALFCDGSEVCLVGSGCQDGIAPDCGDGVGCTIDSCNEMTDGCDHTADDTDCDNGLFCDGNETCDVLLGCQDGTVPDCTDAVGCTTDTCNETTDQCDHAPDDDVCDNGSFCDGDETCDVLLGCQDGAAPDCTDAVGCTDDSCNETTDQCDNTPDNDACSDGDFCTGVEICDVVTDCGPGADPCPGAECDESSDVCAECLTDAHCDNSVYCDGREICTMGVCEPGAPPDCDDGVACTADRCDEGNQACDNAPSDAACDNNTYCDGAETCDAVNGCQAGPAPTCDDGVSCTSDSCNEATDGCDHAPSDAACDNDTYCDGPETCDATNDCQAGAPPDCDDGVLCTDDACNEGTDTCDHTADDDACSNNVFCDGDETCNATTGCEAAASPPDCDDGVACTDDSCSEALAACNHAPNDALCDNALYCDGTETCNAVNGCQAGNLPDCSDGVGCTVDTCVEDDDTCGHAPDNSLCNNGMYCDGIETCNAIADCVAGSPVGCGDAFVCTTDTCNEATDSCEHSFATCVCGDSEITGNEQCEPPAPAGTYEDCNDNVDNDGDGKVDCRDKSCAPGARGEICDESCTMDQVCARFIRDPAHITYSTTWKPDELYIHGRVPMTGGQLRSSVHALTFELSTPSTPVYRASLEEGDLRGGIAGKRFRFRDTQAAYIGDASFRGGLERVSVRTRKFGGVRYLVFTIRAYGDFSAANHRLMTTELSIGTEVGFLTSEWTATQSGWLLHQKDF